MKLQTLNFSHLTGTLAAAGAIAGTIVNAAGASHLHIPSAIMSLLIALAWFAQSPLNAGGTTATVAATSPSTNDCAILQQAAGLGRCAMQETSTLAVLFGSNVITAFITGALSRRTESEKFLLDQVRAAWTELHRLKGDFEVREREQLNRIEQLVGEVEDLRLECEALRREIDGLRTGRGAVKI